MPQILPLVPSIPNYRVGTTLGGTPYILDVRWNGREGAWYMDLLEEDETPIAMGMKLVLGTLLGVRSTNPAFPPGGFAVADLSGEGREAGLDDMGSRVLVYYLTPEELAAGAS